MCAELKSDFGLNRATELSFSGGSAGGIGVFINIVCIRLSLSTLFFHLLVSIFNAL